jgi:hypothetical protein
MRKEGEPTTICVLDNTFENALLEPIRFETSGYNMDDTVIIRGNRWILNSGGGITEGYNSADIGVLNLASYADNLDVGAAPTRNYIFNASDNDNVYSTTNAVDGQNVTLWVEESATWEWYEGAYTFLGVPITANGPTYKTVTPLMALPCLAFNGTTEHLPGILRYSAAGGGTSGSFKSFDGVFQDDAKTIIMAIYVEGATANSASAWLNHGIFCDQQDGFGIFVRNNSGTYKVQAFSWHYPTASVVELTISLNTTYVVCARHDGVNLYLSLDGGTESSIAALPSTRLEGRWLLGANGQLTQFFQGRIGEIKTWNTCLSGGTLATEISTMTTKW